MTPEEKQEIVAAVLEGLRDADPPLAVGLVAGAIRHETLYAEDDARAQFPLDGSVPVESATGQTVGAAINGMALAMFADWEIDPVAKTMTFFSGAGTPALVYELWPDVYRPLKRKRIL